MDDGMSLQQKSPQKSSIVAKNWEESGVESLLGAKSR